MDKDQIAAQVRDRFGDGLSAEAAVEAVLDVMARAVAAGDKVSVRGFGTLEQVDRKPRVGRNPRTGDRVDIPARPGVRFRPGETFAALLDDPDCWPDRPVTRRRSPGERGAE